MTLIFPMMRLFLTYVYTDNTPVFLLIHSTQEAAEDVAKKLYKSKYIKAILRQEKENLMNETDSGNLFID